MNRNMLRGIIVLIVLLGIAGVFLLIDKDTETETVYNPSSDEELDKIRDNQKVKKQPITIAGRQPPPGASPHGHWHGDEWHDALHAPVPKTSAGPLTHHTELLETHPVEALRLQAKERGHWSAKWIPPFPPDDAEAAAIARDIYLITYYESIGDTTNPICLKTLRNREAQIMADFEKRRELSKRSDAFTFEDRVPPSEAYKQYKWELARHFDLGKLSWIRSSGKNIFDREGYASNFPIPK